MSYDSEVRISTRLDNTGITKGVAMSAKEIEKLNAAFQKQTESIKKQSAAIEDMRRKLQALEAGEKSPASLTAMEAQLKRITAEIKAQGAEQAKLVQQYEQAQLTQQAAISMGDPATMAAAAAEVERLDNALMQSGEQLDALWGKSDALASKIQEVKLDPGTSAEAQALRDKIANAEETLEGAKDKANGLKDALLGAYEADPAPMQSKVKQTGDNAEKAAKSMKRLGNETRSAGTNAGKAAKGFGVLGGRLMSLVGAALVFNVVRRGLTELQKYMSALLKSNKEFSASWNAIKVNLLTAFAPIWEVIQPALVSFMNVLAKVTQMLATFIAMLFGKTYQQAKDSAKALDAQAKAIDGVGGAAKNASKQLYAFDQVNQQVQEESGGGGGGSAGGLNFEDMEPPDMKWLEPFTAALQRISDLFMSGFWEGFASADLSKLKIAIEGIWQSLKDIFTDPEVVGAFNRLVKAWIYNLGRIVGSLASIGVSIATAILGGINIFLDENKDSIKQHLVSMFDIKTEALNIMGDFFVALADIFTVLAGENSQKIVASMLGIFYEVGRLIGEIGARIGRDFIDLLTTPIIENKDKIKLVLDDILGFFASLIDDIKELIKYGVDKIITLYDDHIKPFIDTVKDAFTEWFEHILDGWNTHIKPVLDAFAKKLTEVVNNHVKPMIDKAVEYFGKLFDFMKMVWDNVLKPLVSWMIDFFAPIIGSALETVGNVFNTLFAAISDVVGSIFQILGGVIDFITGVFTGDWEKAWNGVKDIFKGIWNGIVSIIEGAINLIINGINGITSGINSILKSDVAVAAGITFSIPQIPRVTIPRLATGGVVGHGLYELGEDGAEAVIPLENNTGWINAVASQFADAFDSFAISPRIMGGLVERGAAQGSRTQELGGTTIAELLNGIGETIAVSLASMNAQGASGDSQQRGNIYLNGRKVGEILFDDLADVGKGRGVPFVMS